MNPVAVLTSGKITANDLGKTVYLSNSNITCQEWVIADVNHDGTSGTVDLFSKTTLTNDTAYMNYAGGSMTNEYAGSSLDSFTLGPRVYNNFATEVKNALNLMNVVSNGSVIQRHIVAPSITEMGLFFSSNMGCPNEGNIYPIFSPARDYNTKARYKAPNGKRVSYLTRTPSNSSTDVWVINESGSFSTTTWYHQHHVVARIRFAKA